MKFRKIFPNMVLSPPKIFLLASLARFFLLGFVTTQQIFGWWIAVTTQHFFGWWIVPIFGFWMVDITIVTLLFENVCTDYTILVLRIGPNLVGKYIWVVGCHICILGPIAQLGRERRAIHFRAKLW